MGNRREIGHSQISEVLTGSLLLEREPNDAEESLQIVVSIILDLNPAPLFVMMEQHVRGEVLLQSVLQVEDCRCECWSP